jgi:hypothetical protein
MYPLELQAVKGYEMKQLTVELEDMTELSITEPRGPFGNYVEDRLEVSM